MAPDSGNHRLITTISPSRAAYSLEYVRENEVERARKHHGRWQG